MAETRELKKIMKEPAVAFGGFAALLLQIAHPSVGRGVANHSDFAYRALDRADNTGIYIYTMVFGTEEEKAAMRHWVNQAHVPVKGGSGATAYSAKDPRLQLWVAATIYVGMIGGYEMAYGPISPAIAERVYQEFSIMATSLQCPPEMWPKDRAAFRKYYNDVVENELVVLPEAKKVLYDLFKPKGLPIFLRPIFPIALYFAKCITIEQLPPQLRDGFGLNRTKTSKFSSNASIAVFLAINPIIPSFIRHAPKNYYMWKMRRMIKKKGLVKAVQA
ncbi:hypothetical protein P152DRAFT_397319 [Eremomyces bilateralis CBS 781.70]|uniref:ER-bound oxygenase mpaB/mpaB'/Rubber oxygenase catalytic domain-containing protein n=1 Tax=Eremomyces bilateralis CBS 781.70 TaxID=1392243 RepID=A0A6G1G2Y0_9PEZI|nr:uncharacterized protein P152DRAFT_397319 [Eremomyces bilateralis CBS 781.70]KAF1812414.1 hypothetical protein P152DRAFT_397319 [Eremomyces bilateralis CBS 781.70]